MQIIHITDAVEELAAIKENEIPDLVMVFGYKSEQVAKAILTLQNVLRKLLKGTKS